ncbi:hypothetical protein [Pseudoneobacillus sp. C159]
MHSIVIHLNSKPREWHLVEPLFYKVLASKQLVFIESFNYEDWDQVYKQVVSFILFNRLEHWQLILLNNHEQNKENPNSLTRELQFIKEKFLNRLTKKGIEPQRKILLTLDGLKRNADYSPIIIKNHYQWQMDIYGYIKHPLNHRGSFGNAFLDNEILSIDLVWGEKVNLKDAGIMDKPSERFLADLSKRRTNVEELLLNLIREKKEIAIRNHLIRDDFYYELHSCEILETIYEEFCQQLGELCTPPFSYHLNTFLPSNLLKTIIQENIGISSVIGDFLFIRKSVSEVSPFQKTHSLLEYVFLLNAICIKPEVIDRVRNGLFFEVEVVLREEEFKQMYSNYYVCLQMAKEKIDNRNLGQEHYMTNKFAEINSLPYTTKPLEEIVIEKPVFQFKSRRVFLQDWKRFLEYIESSLKNREEISLQSAKEGVKILSFTKRQKHDHYLEELVNIKDYSLALQTKKHQLQADIDEIAPSLSSSRLHWTQALPTFSRKMETLVKALPTQNILIISWIIAFMSLLIPYLSTESQLEMQNVNLLLIVVFPGFLIAMVSLICYFTYRSLLKPINSIVEEALLVQKELADDQNLTHAEYNDYLNAIYKLFRIRKQFQEIEIKAVQQKEKNVLYRWHQGEIIHHLTLLRQLLDSLEMETNYDDKEKGISFFQTFFDVEKNVYQNPIYSPLECQFEVFGNGHSIDVYVENSRDEIQIRSLNPIEKIRFIQDKVYSV